MINQSLKNGVVLEKDKTQSFAAKTGLKEYNLNSGKILTFSQAG